MSNQFDWIFFASGCLLLMLVWSGRGLDRSLRQWMSAGTVLVLLGGFWLARLVGNAADTELRNRLLSQANAIAQTINPERVKKLTFTASDKNSCEFLRLRRQMTVYANAMNQRSIYSMAMREGKILFGPESLAENDPLASPPGTVYRQPPAELCDVFRCFRSRSTGIYTDEYGTFVSAFAPIADPLTKNLLLVIGMDVDAGEWQTKIARKRVVPMVFAFAIILLLAGSTTVLQRRNRMTAARQWEMRHAEAYIAVAIGLTLTTMAAYLAHDLEYRANKSVFFNLAESQAARIVDNVQWIRDGQLNGLAHLFEASIEVTQSEFHTYAAANTDKNNVYAWAWIPVVPCEARAAFEAEVRRQGQADFFIYEKDTQGNKIPAAQRQEYYPIRYVEPMAYRERALGYDHGADIARKKAIDDVAQNGMPGATDPVPMVDNSEMHSVIVYYPVFEKDGKKLQGLVLAALHMPSIIGHSISRISHEQTLVIVELYQLQADSTAIRLAVSHPQEAVSDHALSKPQVCVNISSTCVVMPIFIFGKAYAVVVHPGPGFAAGNLLRGAIATSAAGLLFTVLIAMLVNFLSNRRMVLETEVQKRTTELRVAKEYLDRIINTVADPIFVKDRQHRWVLLNDAMCQFMGGTRDDLLGKSDYDFFPAQEADVFWAKDEEVFRSQCGYIDVNEESFTDASGVTHWITTKKSCYLGPDGNMMLVGIIRDTTARKQSTEKNTAAQKPDIFADYQLLQRTMGDHELAIQVLQLFVEEVPIQLAAMKKSITSGDIENLRRLAKSFKGCAANVGASTLFRLSLEIEKNAGNGNTSEMMTLHAQLEDEAARFRAFVEKDKWI